MTEVQVNRWMKRAVAVGLVSLSLIAPLGCSDDDDDDNVEMVTITGVVRNADIGVRSPGIRVTLLDTDFSTDVPTGNDGAFTIMIPKGSNLIFHTDDFDAGTNVYFPMINVDYPTTIANGNIENLAIHCCPHTAVPNPGSEAAWDNYLVNGDAANGDMYVATSSAGSGGVLSLLFFDSEDGKPKFPPMRLTSSSPDFVIGYCDESKFFSENGPDPNVGPHILFPPDYSGTTPIFFSFGKPGTTLRSVTVSAIDVLDQYSVDFPSSQSIPVRPGTITLGLFCGIDGVAGKSFTEWGNEVGAFGKPGGVLNMSRTNPDTGR